MWESKSWLAICKLHNSVHDQEGATCDIHVKAEDWSMKKPHGCVDGFSCAVAPQRSSILAATTPSRTMTTTCHRQYHAGKKKLEAELVGMM